MDMAEVKSFNAELSGLYDNKPPISKAKMSAITKGAIKAIKFYKHVVHSVEKFIQKCKPEYKVPGLYVIDSIVRQSRHQFGQDKDVFAPRFAKNMQQTFANLFRCPPDDKRNIIRVLNLWQKNNVFSPEVIQPLMDMADPNHPLHQEIQQQQSNSANGSSLNVSHNTTDNKLSPVPASQHTPHASTPMGDQFQDQPSGQSGVKFNRKLLNDFEYDSEDEPPSDPPPPVTQHTTHTQNQADAIGSILTNPEIMRQLQSLQAQMQMMTGMQIPNLMPMMTDMQLQQNQNQTLPFLNPQDQQKQGEPKDDMANESDIEFVDTGPQVIEIPDANDSRSPSPKSRRHRSRSKSPRRRGRRSRSRSPRRRRDRERERERDRDKDKEKSYKEREAEREKQKEREKKGLPPMKKDNLSVCSTTLWVGHLSKLATQEELSDLFGAVGGVVSIDVVAPRGCAFVVMERRRDAAKALAKLNKHKLHSKEITVAWAPGKGVKGREWKDYWESELGVSYLPWEAVHARWSLGALSLDALEDGGAVDEDTLPPWLPPRIIPKSIMDNMMIPGLGPGAMPLPSMPTLLPGMLPTMAVPRMPPPGMTAGIPPGMAPGMPPGIRPPSIPTGVPGLQRDAGLPPPGPLLGFPPGMPAISQQGMVGGYLSGLLGVGGMVGGVPILPHHTPTQRTSETTHTDDAMDLDTEDNHLEEPNNSDSKEAPAPPPLLSDQLQALLSKPPPNFNASEPPPGFNVAEPPPFNANQPPPAEEKEEDRKDRDRDRRDRDRDRDRRDRDRRDRDRRDRGRDRDRDREDRRDRDRDRGRERRDRDRDRDRDRERFTSRDNREDRSREKSPRNPESNPEKTLQERLWEMANGKPSRPEEKREGSQENRERDERGAEETRDELRMDRLPPAAERRADGPPAEEGSKPAEGETGWTQLPPPPPHMAPAFRAELRMRGPPRQPTRGPWMDGPPGPFGPRFNGIGPLFNRPPFDGPPFERPPFDGPPMFDGPPRFERPAFNRMPFDNMNRPPFDGPRPPFDGPRPPFDGPRPPFDGPRPPFDGPRPPFDGPRPPFDGPRPPFDGPRPPFDGPRQFDGDRPFDGRFDGPPEFFDRNNRRFDDREQYNDRGWNGDRDRDRDWDRRNEWDDRRRDRRPREQEDRFRDRNDRRRNYDDRSRTTRDDRNATREDKDPGKDDRNPPRDEKSLSRDDRTPVKDEKPPVREERNTRRDKDRKSRWGAADETQIEDKELQEQLAMASEAIINEDPEIKHNNENVISSQEEYREKVTDKSDDNEAEETVNNTEINERVEESYNNEQSDIENVDHDKAEKYANDDKEISDSNSTTDQDNEKETTHTVEETNDYNTQQDTESTRDDSNENSYIEEDKGEPKEVPDFDAQTNQTDLYDANDAVDTSFSMASVEKEGSPQVEKEAMIEPDTSKDVIDDIFGQETETSKETQDNSEVSLFEFN